VQRKSVNWRIKSTDDDSGTFVGLASVFDNVDAHGDIVRRGAFTKSIAAGQPIPLLWEHKADDPRNYVGDVIGAAETAEGLEITGRFDLDTEHGAAAYRNVKGRRVSGLSIGYSIRNSTKTAAGHELTDLDLVEISVVARGANDRALVAAVKSAARPTAPIRSALAKAAVERYHQDQTKGVPPMFENRLETLTKDRDSQLALVKQIIDTADELGPDLTADESASVEEATAKAKELDHGIARVKNDMAFVAEAKKSAAIFGALDDMARSANGEHTEGHLAMTGKHAKALAQRVIKEMPRDPYGTRHSQAACRPRRPSCCLRWLRPAAQPYQCSTCCRHALWHRATRFCANPRDRLQRRQFRLVALNQLRPCPSSLWRTVFAWSPTSQSRLIIIFWGTTSTSNGSSPTNSSGGWRKQPRQRSSPATERVSTSPEC
jgi:HK97 family phage prohead protease